MAKDDRGKGKHRQHDRGIPKGWLILKLGDDEQGMPPGQAILWAVALVPGARGMPTVDAARDAYPDAVPIGDTADGQPVTLRALTGAHEDDDEDDEHAPVINPLHEVQCPVCGTTVRARMADAELPAEERRL